MKRLLILLAFLPYAAHAQTPPSPASMGITPTSPQSVQVLDNSRTWVTMGTINAHTYTPGGTAGVPLTAPGLISNGTKPTATGVGGTCATGTTVGGATAGTVVLTGVCASGNSVSLNSMTGSPPNGWICDATDRNTRTALFLESASNPTSVTFTVGAVSSVANDVLQWKCIGY